MTEHSTASAETIPSLVEQQLRLCERLDALSDRQHGLVEAEDTDGLLRVLGERQTVIEAISAVTDRLGPFRASWEAHVSQLEDADRDSVRSMLCTLEDTMRRVAERDEADRVMMESRRNRVRDLAGGVKRSGAAMNAYGGPLTKGPRFQDRSA